jgi:hypothetical protein
MAERWWRPLDDTAVMVGPTAATDIEQAIYLLYMVRQD